MNKRDGFGHEKAHEGETNDWITPKYIIDALGPFDLDPCASLTQPWPTARQAFTVRENGLRRAWFGNVWLNPPYGPHTPAWVTRLAKHGTGIALIFARLETILWHEYIFPTADGYLFPRRRINFYRPNGLLPKGSAGAPSALIAWGAENCERLVRAVETKRITGVYFDRAMVDAIAL